MKSLVKYAKPTILNLTNKQQNATNIETQENLNSKTEDILNSILPPREYTIDKKQLYIENVLSTPSTREDVIALYEELLKRLLQKEAREHGICPIREDLYSQCFDELIRQITISCSQRGLLLVRVKDEMKMNIESYQRLYESALSYGIRKTLIFMNEKDILRKDIKEFGQLISDLETEVSNLEGEIESIQQNDSRQEILDKQKHDEEIQAYQKNIKRLKEELEKRLSV